MLNIITKGSIGCYETLGVSYAETNLQLSGPKTGMVVAGCGLLGVVFLLSFKALGRLFAASVASARARRGLRSRTSSQAGGRRGVARDVTP